MIQYRILRDHKLIAICNWGRTSLEDIVKLRQALLNDPLFSPNYDAIVDSTQLENIPTRDEIDTLNATRMAADSHPGGKIAIIASSDLLFGISRMHETVSEIYGNTRNSCVFRDSASALDWLDKGNLDIESIFEEIKGLEIG